MCYLLTTCGYNSVDSQTVPHLLKYGTAIPLGSNNMIYNLINNYSLPKCSNFQWKCTYLFMDGYHLIVDSNEYVYLFFHSACKFHSSNLTHI